MLGGGVTTVQHTLIRRLNVKKGAGRWHSVFLPRLFLLYLDFGGISTPEVGMRSPVPYPRIVLYPRGRERVQNASNPIQELNPRTIVLTGWSQSACYLIRYLNDIAYLGREHSVFDGFLAAGAPRYFPVPLNQYETLRCAQNDKVQIQKVKEPCIVLQTESENAILGAYQTVRNDGDERDYMCRHYDIAGASHGTVYSLIEYYEKDEDLDRIGFRFGYPGQNEEPNNYPLEIPVGAMFRNLFYWIDTGVAPQPCDRIRADSSGENVKDALGISVGGIRTCLLDYPTGSFCNYSDKKAGGSAVYPDADKDVLFGHEEPFPGQMLRKMYGSLDNYRKLCTEHTLSQVMKGFVVREDAELLIEKAMERAVRRGLM